MTDNVADENQAPSKPVEAGRQAQGPQGVTIALLNGERIDELPTDLYIPPEALQVFLEAFQGPLDLLLYLIRRQNLDILEIKVAEITAQYMQYIDLMQALELELAGEYLLMAAMLAEIKSRMLLPRVETEYEDEGDPRAELIRRLQEYEQIKSGAENIAEMPRVERDIHLVAASRPELVRQHSDPEVDFKDVLLAMAHEVQLEPLSVRDRMGMILEKVRDSEDFFAFNECFRLEEGRMGVIVTFLAIMELVRESLVEFIQSEPFAPIHIRSAANASEQTPVFMTTYRGEGDQNDAEASEKG